MQGYNPIGIQVAGLRAGHLDENQIFVQTAGERHHLMVAQTERRLTLSAHHRATKKLEILSKDHLKQPHHSIVRCESRVNQASERSLMACSLQGPQASCTQMCLAYWREQVLCRR